MTSLSREQAHELAGSIPARWDAVIGGASVPAASGRSFATISPRDGRAIADVAECGEADVDAAVRSARAAFADGRWAHQHPRQRRAVLQRLARLIEENRHELAVLETVDMGKPLRDADLVDVRVTIQTFDFYAEAIDKVYDEVAPTHRDTLATITREPIGVIAAVVPWNFPLMLAAWKVAPALAMGNSVVLKPSELSPLTAIRLGQLALEAGLPDGVLNVVPGDGPSVGAALGLHRDVDAVTFTGSGPVGRAFLRYAADSNLKQVSLELGGKSPQLVMADAPSVDRVASGVIDGIFHNQGQMCSAGSRLLVHRSRKDELLDAVAQAAAALVVGDPLDPATTHGALVGERHLDRVMGFVDRARAEGARPVIGGSRILEETGGSFVAATVLDDVTPEMEVAREEVFGPVLAVLPFDEPEEAVALANATPYGLAASVWSENLSTAHSVARDLRAGTVWVNCFDASDISVPFGGYGESGFGRDKSLHALDKYSQIKTTWIQL